MSIKIFPHYIFFIVILKDSLIRESIFMLITYSKKVKIQKKRQRPAPIARGRPTPTRAYAARGGPLAARADVMLTYCEVLPQLESNPPRVEFPGAQEEPGDLLPVGERALKAGGYSYKNEGKSQKQASKGPP